MESAPLILHYYLNYHYHLCIPYLSRTSPKGCPKHHGHKGDSGVTPGYHPKTTTLKCVLVQVGVPG